MDAPWHYAPTSEGKPARTIDEVPLDWCYGSGIVLDIRHLDINAAATVVLIAAVWAGLLAVWFTLFGIVMKGHDVSLILPVILLGASASAGLAYVVPQAIRNMARDLVPRASGLINPAT